MCISQLEHRDKLSIFQVRQHLRHHQLLLQLPHWEVLHQSLVHRHIDRPHSATLHDISRQYQHSQRHPDRQQILKPEQMYSVQTFDNIPRFNFQRKWPLIKNVTLLHLKLMYLYFIETKRRFRSRG